MAHVIFAACCLSTLTAALSILFCLAKDTLADADSVVLPIICEEPAASHVEGGQLAFVPFVVPTTFVQTMPRPTGVQ